METNGSPSAPSSALRERFGDQKIPDITRKITACVACRKQKIKCYMGRDGHPPCTRCKKRGLPCTVNKSLQTILESDADWKASMDRKLQRLESALSKVASHVSFPDDLDLEVEQDDGQAEGKYSESLADLHDGC